MGLIADMLSDASYIDNLRVLLPSLQRHAGLPAKRVFRKSALRRLEELSGRKSAVNELPTTEEITAAIRHMTVAGARSHLLKWLPYLSPSQQEEVISWYERWRDRKKQPVLPLAQTIYKLPN